MTAPRAGNGQAYLPRISFNAFANSLSFMNLAKESSVAGSGSGVGRVEVQQLVGGREAVRWSAGQRLVERVDSWPPSGAGDSNEIAHVCPGIRMTALSALAISTWLRAVTRRVVMLHTATGERLMTFRVRPSMTVSWLMCAAALFALVLAPGLARAQEPAPSRPVWAEVSIGGGPLHRVVFGSADDPGHVSVAGGGGYVIDQHLLVGFQAGAQAALGGPDDAPGGLNLSLLAVAKIYPSKMSGFHVRLGAGLLVMKDETFTHESDENALFGAAWEAGLGFDVRLRGDWCLGPFVTFRRSAASGLREDSLTVGLAWTDR